MIAIFSRGIRRIPHLQNFLQQEVIYRPARRHGDIDQVAGWGVKTTSLAARQYATAEGLPFLALEDGFLRSYDLGVRGAPPLSLVLDDLGIYYDATRPSRLEALLNGPVEELDTLLPQARQAMALIRRHRLSKYNCAPERLPPLPPGRPRVLVVDQTYGDMSVQLGMADAASFERMYRAALDENPDATVLVKVHPDVVAGKKRGYLTHPGAHERTVVLHEEVNPLSLLEQVDKVYVVTSQLGFEALLLGKPVVCFGMPFYAGWGATEDRIGCPRRTARRSVEQIFAAAYLRYARYIQPATGVPGTIFDVIDHLARQKTYGALNAGTYYCFGFQLWKRHYVRPFLAAPGNRLRFAHSLAAARAGGLAGDARLLAWGHSEPPEVSAYAAAQGMAIERIEDGFIRSLGLGSDLIRPMSLVVDSRGVYYDPNEPSDLEYLLEQGDFDPALLARARALRERLVAEKVTKYNTESHSLLNLDAAPGRTRILVPGQVEDDASIRLGCTAPSTNEGLLRAVRKANPDAYIVFKPHPDAQAGNRRGRVPGAVLRQLCDRVETSASVISCIDAVDEVHTMTSLTGFDALLRGKKVETYGGPFYAGWGLTHDHRTFPRRTRRVTLDELVAGTLLVYPRYWIPGVGFVRAEDVVEAILIERRHLEAFGPEYAQRALQPGFVTRQLRKTVMLLKGWAHGWSSTT